MTQRRLIHGGVLISVGALFALNLPSCSSGSPADGLSGTAGGPTIPIGTSAGNSNVPASGAGAGAIAGAASVTSAGASGVIDSSTGGAPGAAGGSVAAGGAAVVCDDKPPNNGDTCAHAVQYNWCTQDWLADSCLQSCKKCTAGTSSGSAGSSSTSSGSAGSSSMSGGPTIPPVSGGQDGWASRYWDCCKPSCGWSQTACSKSNGTSKDGGQDACQGGSAYMCYDFAPWAVSDTLSYGFVAAAHENYSCGKCFQFTFNGQGSANSASLNGKSMIVQVINTGGDVQSSQFDLLLPGGGVGVNKNACANELGTSLDSLGAQYGGFATTCGNDPTCIKNKCDTIFAGKPDLQAGCSWYLGWYGGADNPKLSYKEIACPQAIKDKSGH